MQNAAYYIFFFNPKCFALVGGYSAEKTFHRGNITQKRLRTTGVEYRVSRYRPPFRTQKAVQWTNIKKLNQQHGLRAREGSLKV